MKMRKGFTLIELMIVIAIIAIIAAIAIPNLMQSRIRANEATAMTATKNYNTAQVTFQVGRQGRNTLNTAQGARGYVFNYRNLFYGNPVNNSKVNLALISKAHADAFITTDSGKDGTVNNPTTPATEATPYAGYHYANPKELSTLSMFAANFGQVAVPANSNSTGNNAYWVGQEGTVYAMGLNPTYVTPEEAYTAVSKTPSSTGGDAYQGWEGL